MILSMSRRDLYFVWMLRQNSAYHLTIILKTLNLVLLTTHFRGKIMLLQWKSLYLDQKFEICHRGGYHHFANRWSDQIGQGLLLIFRFGLSPPGMIFVVYYCFLYLGGARRWRRVWRLNMRRCLRNVQLKIFVYNTFIMLCSLLNFVISTLTSPLFRCSLLSAGLHARSYSISAQRSHQSLFFCFVNCCTL